MQQPTDMMRAMFGEKTFDIGLIKRYYTKRDYSCPTGSKTGQDVLHGLASQETHGSKDTILLRQGLKVTLMD